MRTLCYFFAALSLLVTSVSKAPLFAEDDISVRRDSDKTVYTIDSGDESKLRQQRQRDEALEVLRNTPVIIDGRGTYPPPPPVRPPVPVR